MFSYRKYLQFCLLWPLIVSLVMWVPAYFIDHLYGTNKSVLFVVVVLIFGAIPYLPFAIWLYLKTRKLDSTQIQKLYNKFPLYMAPWSFLVLFIAAILYGYPAPYIVIFVTSLIMAIPSTIILGYIYVAFFRISAWFFLRIGLLRSE